MRVGIDICNTIADVNECIRQALNLSDTHVFARYGLSEYGIDDAWFLNNREVYAEAKPIPGSVEALDILAQNKAEIYYVTARSEEVREITRDWLKKWGFPPGRLIMAQPKDKVVQRLSLDWIVDDAPPEIRKLAKTGVNTSVYKQPYNKGLFTWQKFHVRSLSNNGKLQKLPPYPNRIL